MKLYEQIGLLRSRLIYYAKPFNHRRLRRFYSQLIKPNDLCFDIGAHLGNRSNAWLSLGAKVIAVEPQPACAQYLEKHFSHHADFQNLAKAIGSKSGSLKMHINSFNPTISTFADANWREALFEDRNWSTEWDQLLEVEVITLDQMIATYGLPDFCKIDVEDFEEEALKGLSQAIPKLSFEFFNYTWERTQNCLQILQSLGDYQYNWSVGESQKWMMKEWADQKNLIKSINSYPNPKFSGDIYAKLKEELNSP